MSYTDSENINKNYERKLHPEMDFESSNLEEFDFKHKEELIETSVKKFLSCST